MDFTHFQTTAEWIGQHGYLFMFIAMAIEGQIATMAAAFGVALGYFNLLTVFGLAVSADLMTDIIYYSIGNFGKSSFVQKVIHRFKLSNNRIEKIKGLVQKHPVKTLTALKLTPFLSTPGLIIVGYSGMAFRKFIAISLLVIIPKSIVFMLLGYYFSVPYFNMVAYFHDNRIIAITIAIAIFLVYVLYQKITKEIAKRIETL